jgi:hypothetical protein
MTDKKLSDEENMLRMKNIILNDKEILKGLAMKILKGSKIDMTKYNWSFDIAKEEFYKVTKDIDIIYQLDKEILQLYNDNKKKIEDVCAKVRVSVRDCIFNSIRIDIILHDINKNLTVEERKILCNFINDDYQVRFILPEFYYILSKYKDTLHTLLKI